jgi:hypothetical protein
MELTFTKVGDKYVAQFTVTSDFNIHIEKSGGRIVLFQSSIENGSYDYVSGATIADTDGVFDSDFTALIYPKYIKMTADVMPTKAVVTFAE